MGQYAIWIRDGWLVVFVLVTSYTDLRFQRIRNNHTFPSMGVGLVLGGLAGGWGGLGFSASGLGVGLLLMGVLFAVGVMKAGDVKLAMAFGALCGPADVLRGVILSFILYLPVGVVYLASRSGPAKMWMALKRTGRFFYTLLHPMLKTESLDSEGMTFAPFGMVLGVAMLVAHFRDWLGLARILP